MFRIDGPRLRKNSRNRHRLVIADADYESLFVSQNGSDDMGDGSSLHPYKSIGFALSSAASIDKNRIRILIREGEYRTLGITIDSSKVIELVGVSENVIIKGSRVVSFTDNGDGTAYSNEIGFNSWNIYVNGHRRILASTKRIDLFSDYIGATISSISSYVENGITYSKISLPSEDINSLIQDDRYRHVFVTVFRYWGSLKCRIISVNSSDNTVTIKPPKNPGQGSLVPGNGNWIIYENIDCDLISSPGSNFGRGTYYIDNDGRVHYKYAAGENINNIIVEIPVTDRLFDIYTQATLFGLKFCHTNYDFFDDGYTCTDNQSAYSIIPAIRVFGNRVRILKCDFYQFSNTCIGFMNGASYGVVDSCYFHNNGCSSVRIGELDESEEAEIPRYIAINNNVVELYGELLQQSAGMIYTFADHLTIEHNDISKGFYTALTGGHIWGYSEHPSYRNCTIRKNILHHICNGKMQDLGAFYTIGSTINSFFEFNICHDIKGNPTTGIYLDEGTQALIVRKNIVYNASNTCYYSHACKENKIYNNIFAFGQTSAYSFSGCRDEEVYKNIVYQTKSAYILGSSSTTNVHDNLYYGMTNDNAASIDSNPYFADPSFKNPPESFSITDMTAANLIGFIPIKTDKAGVYGKYMISKLHLNDSLYSIW
jgi:hypothetical protein